MKFEINNDLNSIKLSKHNFVHLIGSFILVLIYNWYIGYGLWFLWEITDGFKPWFYKFKYNDNQTKFINYFRQNLFYSDKFSLQDIFIWNLIGSLIGLLTKSYIITYLVPLF